MYPSSESTSQRFYPTATFSLPAPPLMSDDTFNPFASQSSPHSERWERSDLGGAYTMPQDYGRSGQVPATIRVPQPIPIPQSRARRNSFNRGAPLVGGISLAYTSPLQSRFLLEPEDISPRNNSSDSLPFVMDELDPASSFSSSPTSAFSPDPYIFTGRKSRSKERRSSVSHPLFGSFSSSSPSYASSNSAFADFSPMSSALPMLDLSSPNAGSPSSSHTGASSLFGKSGSSWSDESSAGGVPKIKSKAKGTSSQYGYSDRPSSKGNRNSKMFMPQAPSSQHVYGSPSMQMPSRNPSPQLPPPNFIKPSSAPSGNLPPFSTSGPSSRSSYRPPQYGHSYTPSGPPDLRLEELKAAIAGNAKRRPKFTLGGGEDSDGGSSSSGSTSSTPKARSNRFF